MTRHQYGTDFCSRSSEVISQETSGSVGKYRLFSHSPKLGERERKKVILAMKIIVAGLKSKEIHEENVINSLQTVITITQRKDIMLYFYKHVLVKKKLILNKLIFLSVFYMHCKGPVLIFPLSRSQIFHGQSVIWVQD